VLATREPFFFGRRDYGAVDYEGCRWIVKDSIGTENLQLARQCSQTEQRG
jgi:hypothetical protein